MWVTASKDFGYDESLTVKTGQLFELRGCRNDGLLLKHRLVLPVDPQPDAEALKHFPQCPVCGRRFTLPGQRERCGKQHEMTSKERLDERHQAAQKRMDKLQEKGLV